MGLMPQIKLFEFNEQRIRKPIVGGLVEDFSEQLLTEPLPAQIERFLSLNEHFLFAPYVTFTPYVLDNQGTTWISLSYSFPGICKADLVRLMYS